MVETKHPYQQITKDIINLIGPLNVEKIAMRFHGLPNEETPLKFLSLISLIKKSIETIMRIAVQLSGWTNTKYPKELRQEVIELGESVIRDLNTYRLEDLNYLDFPEESIALELIQLNSELLKIQHGTFRWLSFLHETFGKSMVEAIEFIFD